MNRNEFTRSTPNSIPARRAFSARLALAGISALGLMLWLAPTRITAKEGDMPNKSLFCCLGLCLFALPGGSAPANNVRVLFSDGIRFSAAASTVECEIGRPIVLKLTLRNAGADEYTVRGDPGWGSGIGITASEEGAPSRMLRVDIRYLDTNLGSLPSPLYVFTGHIPTNSQQSIVQMIRTEDFLPGRVRLKATMGWLGTDQLQTEDVEVLLSRPKEDEKPALVDAKARSLINKQVSQRHNFFGGFALGHLSRSLVQGLMDSQATTVDVENGLYAAVLQAIGPDATDDDRGLAEDAAKAFLERFPHSWLRAHACAALVTIYRKEGRDDDAQRMIREGLSLPESRPLFQNLGFIGESAGKSDEAK